jgi:hypothetical protein
MMSFAKCWFRLSIRGDSGNVRHCRWREQNGYRGRMVAGAAAGADLGGAA